MKKKNNHLDFINIQKFCATKTTHKEIKKDKPHSEGKYLQNTLDKGLIS